MGKERESASHIMNILAVEGYGIVINTCREGLALADAIKWMEKHCIPYHYLNCNFPHLIEKYSADCRKISADVYIDDKGIEPLPTWDRIHEIINEKFK